MRPSPKIQEFPHFPVTAGTALLAIGVTIAWWAKVDISPLFENAMIRHGQLWRLITSIFPHINIVHLIFNVYWLWIFGTAIERVFGHLKTVALFLLFAFGSNAMDYAFSSGGVGLSGVGYGLFGLLWILSSQDERFQDVVDKRTIQLFIVWFFICVFTTVIGLFPVANTAHGVGAVIGILTGYAITDAGRRRLMVAALCAILVAGIWAATLGRPRLNLSKYGGYEEAQWGYQALQAKRNDEAIRWFREALAYKPNEASIWYDLGIAYERVGDSAALSAYRKAAEGGDDAAQYYLGKLYDSGQLGLIKDQHQAISWYQKSANKGNPAAENDLAWAYATSQDSSIRNPKAALEHALKAVEAEKKTPNVATLDTLAESYYVNGRWQEAVDTEQEALAIVSGENKEQFEKGLKKYQEALKKNGPQSKLK